LLDDYAIGQVALIPMGAGDFILPVYAVMRKHLCKQKDAVIKVALTVDSSLLVQCHDLLACLRQEPVAWERFTAMPQTHQYYYTKWIENAKTEGTRTRRIAMTVNAMIKGMDYGQMLRAEREERKERL